MIDTDFKSRRGSNSVRDMVADKNKTKKTKANDRESYQPSETFRCMILRGLLFLLICYLSHFVRYLIVY